MVMCQVPGGEVSAQTRYILQSTRASCTQILQESISRTSAKSFCLLINVWRMKESMTWTMIKCSNQSNRMQLCQLHPQFQMSSVLDSHTDWAASAGELPAESLRDCPKWISSQRKLSDSASHSPWHRELPAIDVNSLDQKQRHAYEIIKNHNMQSIAGRNPPPLHMIISGTAGSGKSYLISAIAHLLGNACILTGTTGMASFNICGKTLHSTLQLPVRNTNQCSLQGTSLQRLQLGNTILFLRRCQ